MQWYRIFSAKLKNGGTDIKKTLQEISCKRLAESSLAITLDPPFMINQLLTWSDYVGFRKIRKKFIPKNFNRPHVSSHLIEDIKYIQIKIRIKINFVKNVCSSVLWIGQIVSPFFGLIKKIRHYFTKVSNDWPWFAIARFSPILLGKTSINRQVWGPFETVFSLMPTDLCF